MDYKPDKENPNFSSRAFAATLEDEIVISGISGRFPNSNNMCDLSHNLYNKIDIVDADERRWRHTNAEIPTRMGKVNNVEKFDAKFFGVHHKQAYTMDPQCRMLVEHAYEAILDAGVNPKSIRGSRTGVFIGAIFVDTEKTWFFDSISKEGFGMTGCSRAMLANRVSFVLGLTGPSFLLDASCSSSLFALNSAFNAMRNGECDAAIVGGSNLLLNPSASLQFARLGVLAKDGFCRPFDKDGSGYARADGICVIYLQKIKDSKRNYTNLVYSKTNCNGFKEDGMLFPSGQMQINLMNEFYNDINLNPNTVSYVEALTGNAEECKALDQVFCTGRTTPLQVGSIVSNMGHAEATSGLCAIAKVILAFENKKIPPNINFTTLNPDVPSLVEGRLHVVTNNEQLKGSLISINSFGFGGTNAHALFKGNLKEKINNGAPADNLPRLVTWCGRTEEAVNAIFEDIVKRPLDKEFIGLLHSSQSGSVPANIFRGYGVFVHKPNKNAVCLSRSIQHYSGQKRPIVWVFSGMGSQWTQMGLSLMAIPLFKTSIENCHNILATKGLNLKEILTSADPTTFDNILHSFVGIAAIQITIVDILKKLGMEPDFIIGHSVGELGCAYADGCFTAEEMILSAYSRGMASLETKFVRGSMAAIGTGYTKLRSMTPPEIEIACHNSADSCTISGPAQNVSDFVKELKSQGIFAKEVPCSNIPYHSSYISDMGPKLLKRLTEVIKNPKKRSAKWLSSSVPKQNWGSIECQYSSAQYHTNNLLSPVLFEETSDLLPKEALTIEIAPHGLLQAIIKKSMLDSVHIPLTQRGHSNNAEFLIQALGKIHVEGVDIKISNLYPTIEYPVSRGTAMISPLIKWDHSEDWFVTNFDDLHKVKSRERKVKVSLSEKDFEYIEGYTIDGSVLLPPSAYIFLVWETLALMNDLLYSEISVEFEAVEFLYRHTLTKNENHELLIMIHPGTGRFEISELSRPIVTGFVKQVEKPHLNELVSDVNDKFVTLISQDFYKELSLRGYHYNGAFRSVVEARSDGLKGKVKWDMNWVAFIDCLFQIQVLRKDTRSLMLPSCIQRMTIDANKHMEMMNAFEEFGITDKYVDVNISSDLNIICSGGIEIVNLQSTVVNLQCSSYLKHQQIYTELPTRDHCYVKSLIKSELSSLKWMKGPYIQTDAKLVKIQYASLNIRDVMLATGKLTAENVTENRLEYESVLGFEFSGVTKHGKRVMGMTATAAMATHTVSDEIYTFDCPSKWTLAEAATIPVVYGIVYAAFFITAKIEKGKSILIHSGSGGVGLAAIRVAFAYGLEVFTTVSTTDKKIFLMQEFPLLKKQNIGSSCDISFEKLVMTQTKGKGVDFVLNSLTEEKLLSSIRCLGVCGKFLEIGKFDIANDTKIGMRVFMKEISFHSIMLDRLFLNTNEKMHLKNLVNADLKSGIIKPLRTNIFAANQLEQAFKFLDSGNHIGKVLLQIRENEKDEQTLPITVFPRVHCSSMMSYIIINGLSDFGFELADWLVLRGCRNLVLNANKAVSQQYQTYRIKMWESYGVKVVISTSNTSTYSGCAQMIQEALNLAPVGGAFSSDVTLVSEIKKFDQMSNQNLTTPELVATKYLDEITRKLCPHLQHFIVFSNISYEHSQNDYGMVNSIVKQTIELRHKEGLPAKIIQWNTVDKDEDEIIQYKKISFYLNNIDYLMTINEPIVASMTDDINNVTENVKESLLETVMRIMSIKDNKSISMHSSLAELGLNSLTAVEIRQTLDQDYNIVLSPKDLASFTINSLEKLANK